MILFFCNVILSSLLKSKYIGRGKNLFFSIQKFFNIEINWSFVTNVLKG